MLLLLSPCQSAALLMRYEHLPMPTRLIACRDVHTPRTLLLALEATRAR